MIEIKSDMMRYKSDEKYRDYLFKEGVFSFLHSLISDLDKTKVLIFIDEGLSKTFIQVDCDEFGYPSSRNLTTMNLNRIPALGLIGCLDNPKPIEIIKRNIFITQPLVVINEYYSYQTLKIIVWEGKLSGENWQNIENLDVLQLQRIVGRAMDKETIKVVEKGENLVNTIKDLKN